MTNLRAKKKYIIKYIYLFLTLLPDSLIIFFSKTYCKKYKFRYSAFFLTAYISKKLNRSKNFGKKIMQQKEKKIISVIIPTYNRPQSLDRLLQSLKKQSLPQQHFEVIVINNGCLDTTHKICEKFSAIFFNFKEIYEPTLGLLAARNSGVRAACGDVMTFCDDDIEPDVEWLYNIFCIMQNRLDIMLLGGNNRGKFEYSPPPFVENLWVQDEHGIRINSYYSLIEGIPCGMTAPHHGYIMGCNFTTRRKVIESAQGFGPDCMPNIIWQGDGENRVGETAQRMGTVWLDPNVSVIHHMPASRLDRTYIEKRALYFDINNAYNNLRKRNFNFWKNGDDKNKNKNIYLFEACNVKEVREWLAMTTYWGNESPSLNAPLQSTKLFLRNSW